MKTKQFPTALALVLICGAPLLAQAIALPLSKIHDDETISAAFGQVPLLQEFSNQRQSDTVAIEFTAIAGADGLAWARQTSVGLNGFERVERGRDFSTHDVFRLQPIGPEADDEWEEYLYVTWIKAGTNTACAIIPFRCKFVYPEKATDGPPTVAEFEVQTGVSIIK